MEQISSNTTNKYKTTADNLVLEATERIYDTNSTVNATIKKDDKIVASMYIDKRNSTSSISFNNDVLADSATLEALKTNMLDWLKELIDMPVTEPETPTTETTE